MKKILVFLICCICGISFYGFSNSNIKVFVDSGNIQEVVSFNYSELDALNEGLGLNAYSMKLQMVIGQAEQNIKLNIIQKIQNDLTLSSEKKQQFLNTTKPQFSVVSSINSETHLVVFGIVYANSTIWNYMCKDGLEGSETSVNKTAFIKTYTTDMPIKMSYFEDGDKVLNLYEFFLKQLDSLLQGQVVVPIIYQYVYATPTKRIYSNADEISFNNSTGYYYHVWNVSNAEKKSITFWQNGANVVTWYVLALGLTAALAITLYLVSKKRPK